MNRLVSQFPPAAALAGGELLLGWQAGATVAVTPDQIVALVPPIPAAPTVSAAGGYTIEAAANGTLYDNWGAGGATLFELPPWQAGLGFSFAVVAVQTVTIAANGSDAIAVGGGLAASAVSSGLPYSTLTLGTTNAPGIWVARAIAGEWT